MQIVVVLIGCQRVHQDEDAQDTGGTDDEWQKVGIARGGRPHDLRSPRKAGGIEGTATTAERRVLEEYLARKWSAPVTPRAPADVTVTTAAPGSLAVVWDPPSWDGGSPPTGYTATASPGGATCTSAANGCVLTGLVAGATYSVTVTATNAMGAGPASATRTATA